MAFELPSIPSHGSTSTVLFVIAVSILLVLFGSLCYCLVARRSKGTYHNDKPSNSSVTCRVFTFQEVQEATNNFQEDFLLGIEVISGRPALDHGLPTEKINVATWAMNSEVKGQLHQIMDPNIVGKARVSSLNKVWEVAKRCLAENRINRPPIGFVLCCLEDALHLELSNIADEENSFLNCEMQDNVRSESELVAVLPSSL
ncbi:hypothetical protein JHK82_034651 [Glycine max]|nr:hypothetical protein JHK82_034651 [Glycine max]